MPALTDHQSSVTTKMLLVGDSGSGKTGALASLANAGYNVRILDLDNGVDVLANLLRSGGSYKPDALQRVRYVTLTETMKNQSGVLIPGRPKVWEKAIKMLDKWVEEDGTDLGSITTWTPQDVLSIDSLTFLCNAAMARVLMLNARLGQTPHQSDWYQAQGLIEGLLQLLYDDAVKCNVIVNCHISYQGKENEPQTAYPASLGRALSPKIGRYFNSVLLAKTTGMGASQKRQIFTRPQHELELKTSAPTKVQPSYPIETGLADFFKAVRA